MTLADFLALAKDRLSGIYDQRELENVVGLVIEEVLSISRHQMKFKMLNILDVATAKRLIGIVKRLTANEPVQYVLGFADFYGMKLTVNKHVLIPRPETEELVDHAIKSLRPLAKSKVLSILDIGTGSGCIAIALKQHLPNCEITAIDTSAEAIKVAKENARNRQCDVNFINADFLEEKNWKDYGSLDAIVSNPPYVTHDEFSEMMPRVKNFEPHIALIANDKDPFVFYEKIASFSKSHLNDNGSIYLEMNGTHSREIESIFITRSFHTKIIKDLQGVERILVCRN